MRNINGLVRKTIIGMRETNWGEIPENNNFRLMFGENPFVWPECITTIKKEANKINIYPSPTKKDLIKKIAEYNNVAPKNIVVTNGSDDGIELIAKVFLNPNDEVIIPTPSFPIYSSTCRIMDAKIVNVSLDKNFRLDLNKLVANVCQSTKIVWIASPNNPTGNILISKGKIEWLLKKLPNTLIVVDECYFELSQITAKDLIQKYCNLIILRSFSKIFGLAGLRLGYIISNPDVTFYCKNLQQNIQPFSVNRFALASGIAVLSDFSIISELVEKYKKTKRNFEKMLISIKGLEVIPTYTTFSLVKLPMPYSASFVKNALSKKGIYIKDCSIYAGLGSQYIYLGTPVIKAQQKFIKELVNIIKS